MLVPGTNHTYPFTDRVCFMLPSIDSDVLAILIEFDLPRIAAATPDTINSVN